MRRNRKLLVAAIGAALLIGGGLGVARATASDDQTRTASPTSAVSDLDNSSRGQGRDDADRQDDDFRIGGPTAERAAAATLAAVPGATVREVERTTDLEKPQRAYEVKLATTDGALVEVYLDADFRVVEIERARGGKDHDE